MNTFVALLAVTLVCVVSSEAKTSRNTNINANVNNNNNYNSDVLSNYIYSSIFSQILGNGPKHPVAHDVPVVGGGLVPGLPNLPLPLIGADGPILPGILDVPVVGEQSDSAVPTEEEAPTIILASQQEPIPEEMPVAETPAGIPAARMKLLKAMIAAKARAMSKQ